MMTISFMNKMVISQTNVIALKSRAGELKEINLHSDNFGIHPGMYEPKVDSVILNQKGLFYVVYKSNKHFINENQFNPIDTFHIEYKSKASYFEHLSVIKSDYKQHTKLIGFPSDEELNSILNKKKNALSPALTLLLFFSFLTVKQQKSRRLNV